MSIILNYRKVYNNFVKNIYEVIELGYNELKYRQRFTTSIDKNILQAFINLANVKKQPKSWMMDEALEDFLRKNGIEVSKASNDKY